MGSWPSTTSSARMAPNASSCTRSKADLVEVLFHFHSYMNQNHSCLWYVVQTMMPPRTYMCVCELP